MADDKRSAPRPIRIVAGLGNPGDTYAHTRHNAGFSVVDKFVARTGGAYWKQQAGSELCEVSFAGRTIVVVKPQSFMNTSGGPISKVLRAYDATPEELLVIHDDLDIPAGDIRIKFGGGHGGHNGLRSIIEKLGSRDFSRLRVGIGRPPGTMDPADFVLRELRGSAADDFAAEVAAAADALEACLADGVDAHRGHWNPGA